MPRTVSSKIHIDLSAQEVWRLRCDFDLESRIAMLGMRELSLLSEDVLLEGQVKEQRQRLVRCDLVGDHLRGGIMGIKTSDLGSRILCCYFVNLFDKMHGANYTVEMLMKTFEITIEGNQWCVPETDHTCFLCTHIEVTVKMPMVGRMVEKHLEKQMLHSHAEFPKHAYEFLKSTNKLEISHKNVQPIHNFEHGPMVANVSEVVGLSIACSAQNPKLSRLQLAWNMLVNSVPENLTRHKMLCRQDQPSRNAVAVRVKPLCARVMLRFGCASTIVDSDEIVE